MVSTIAPRRTGSPFRSQHQLGIAATGALQQSQWGVDFPPPAHGREIGECIYCGSKEDPLSREHAVPYGLNGPWTLGKASCAVCSKITTRFEHNVMRSLWPDVRSAFSMQSRRRDKRSTTHPLVVDRNGIQETIQVPRSDFPIYLLTPLFAPVSIGWLGRSIQGVFINAETLHIAGPTYKQAAEKYSDGARLAASRAVFVPDDFARMLAKIAFCAGVLTLGIGTFHDSPMRDIILGKDNDLNRLIGGWYGPQMTEANPGLHAIKVVPEIDSRMIHVFIRLLAQFGGPEYQVIVGELRPELIDKATSPPSWFETFGNA